MVLFQRHVVGFAERIPAHRPGPYLTRDDFGMRGVGFSLIWWGVGVCVWPKGMHL